MKQERRTFDAALRVDAHDGKTRLAGHAAVFNSLSVDLGGFREKIAPGAFSKSIGGDVRALFNHDPNIILGRTTAKTLRLSEDRRGLAIEIDPPNTEMGRSVAEMIRRGDVSQMSFGFRTRADQWENVNGEPIRTLLDVELLDVSPVTFPAYEETDVALRSRQSWQAGGGATDGALQIMKMRNREAIAGMQSPPAHRGALTIMLMRNLQALVSLDVPTPTRASSIGRRGRR